MLYGNQLLEPRSYRLPDPDQLRDLFDVAWSNSTRVRGAFGWFSAGWIALFAHGLSAYLDAEHDEPIEFTIAPVLFNAEYNEFERLYAGDANIEASALAMIVSELDRGRAPSSPPLARWAVKALAWLISTRQLVLRVAIPRPGVNYHPKVWLFNDGQDSVVIRGSANATGRAVERGIEHVDVDCSWRDRYRVQAYVDMVDAWAAGDDPALERTVLLDEESLRQHVQRFDTGRPGRQEYEEAVDEAERFARDAVLAPPKGSGSVMPRQVSTALVIPDWLNYESGDYAHQGRAIRHWIDNGYTGLMEIATGGGKTLTSLVAAHKYHAQANAPLLLVIAVPSEPLLFQWAEEVALFGVSPVLPTLAGSPTKRRELMYRDVLSPLMSGDSRTVVPVIVTFDRISAPGFTEALETAIELSGATAMFIGDEAHGLGTDRFLSNIPLFFTARLGLSATPIREYDAAGTQALLDFFGDVVDTFGLADAIGTCLVPYRYEVNDEVRLTDEELREYRKVTSKIGAAMGAGAEDDVVTQLLVKRRAILETAEGKYAVLRRLLEDLRESKDGLSFTLIYTSSKNREQFVRSTALLTELSLSWAGITEDTPRSQRRAYLDEFADGTIDVLVAKQILDEGVNIPATRRAILMASSTTQREWIQRRGRILRKHGTKTDAVLYDVVALPGWDADGLNFGSGSVDAEINRRIVESELKRLRAFNELCSNPAASGTVIDRIHDEFLRRTGEHG